MKYPAALALALSLLAAPAPALAQEAAPDTDTIVVTAQRSGAPMWTIPTERGAVILVGEIAAVPEATPWFPDRLEDATRAAQRVILPVKGKVSPGDILRLIFAGGSIMRLPGDSEAVDYLTEAQFARLTALEERYDKDYARGSLLMTSYDLLARRLGFTKDTGRDASDVVRRAARRGDVDAESVASVRGEDMLDNLAEADPATHLPCLEAAMTATELGPDLIERRGADWRSNDVPAVMANPLEKALGRCWPWTDAEMGPQLRGLYVDAIQRSMQQDGVTLAVVPLRVLAEDDGVLDTLSAQGLAIRGPNWR